MARSQGRSSQAERRQAPHRSHHRLYGGSLRRLASKKLIALAAALREHPEELRADFQQFYNLNIDGMGRDYSILHAAILCVQLPNTSRLKSAIQPELQWDTQTYMLRSIEHSLRLLVWANSKDAQRGRNYPKPIPSPSEEARVSSKLKRTDISHIQEKLGIKEVD